MSQHCGRVMFGTIKRTSGEHKEESPITYKYKVFVNK